MQESQGNLYDALGGDYEEAMTTAPRADFAAIPSGVYPAIIQDSAFTPTKAKDGEYLELTHQIIDGPYKGRLIWARLNLKNKNKTAMDIARADLASIRLAAGVERPQDSSELHNIPLLIRVEFIPAGTPNGKGDKSRNDANEIRAWKSVNDEKAAAQVGAEASTPAPAANGAAPAQPKAATPAPAPQRAAWARPATAA